MQVVYFLSILIIMIGCKPKKTTILQLTKPDIPNTTSDFYIQGADLSFLPQIRNTQALFYNENQQAEDPLQTLHRFGLNTVRLRLWYNTNNIFANEASIKQLVNEIKSRNLAVWLTVHYSDTWADPSQQSCPSAWQNLMFNQMLDSVYQYTQRICKQLKPKYYQLGNETENGILWPYGTYANANQTKLIFDTIYAAVKSVNDQIMVLSHFGNIASIEHAMTRFQPKCDQIAFSYYSVWHEKDLNKVEEKLLQIYSIFKKPLVLAETQFPFTLQWNDQIHNIYGENSQLPLGYSASPNEQKRYWLWWKDLGKKHSFFKGICYWSPEAVSASGTGGSFGSSSENCAFWNFNNQLLPIVTVLK